MRATWLICAAIILCALEARAELRCDTGVLHLDQCYIFVNMSKTWSEAQQDCVDKNGHLVTVGFQDEQDFLENFVSLTVSGKTDSNGAVINAVFIGASDGWKEGDFRWVDTAELTPTAGDFWLPGQPDDVDHTQNGLCLDTSSGSAGKWRDCDVNMRRPYICEMPATGRCDQPPLIIPPNTTDVLCIDIINPSRTGRALGASQCGLTVDMAYTNNVRDFICPGTFTIERNWTVTDSNGDKSAAVQNIKVNNIAPEIIVPDDVTVSCYEMDKLTPHLIGWANGTAGCPGNGLSIVYKDYKNLSCPNRE
ncbi:uncharacterized protein LOC106161336 [Lingula anatina]|uniref:Uncharacterized protein LOC106161336 n=1 Tax=Lingula anatina TaxID=7574 RepID=A0A1S3I8L0_LINAN|nr:uncharacterized protein LOC106161336 [Lingula anatina]|eukprot:XP_013393724.1 uncharacterized protein LOC106161336 [Lingula anatina]